MYLSLNHPGDVPFVTWVIEDFIVMVKSLFFYSNTMSFVILYKVFLSNDYTPIDYCTLCFYDAYINTGISDSID